MPTIRLTDVLRGRPIVGMLGGQRVMTGDESIWSVDDYTVKVLTQRGIPFEAVNIAVTPTS